MGPAYGWGINAIAFFQAGVLCALAAPYGLCNDLLFLPWHVRCGLRWNKLYQACPDAHSALMPLPSSLLLALQEKLFRSARRELGGVNLDIFVVNSFASLFQVRRWCLWHQLL